MRFWLIWIVVAFLAGATTQAIIAQGSIVLTKAETSHSEASFSPKNLMGMITASSPERISPYDWISEKDIHVYSNKVVIDITDPEWAYFTNTNSMDPVLDETSHAIEFVPSSPDQIHIGDIISYQSGDDTIIHRVIGTGKDSDGQFYILKGDNNPTKDPGKVRFEQVRRIVVAIIY